MNTGIDRAGLALSILFLVFVAYEMAGGSDLFPQLHTVSYYAYRNLWLKLALGVTPPVVYLVWWIWHMSSPIFK